MSYNQKNKQLSLQNMQLWLIAATRDKSIDRSNLFINKGKIGLPDEFLWIDHLVKGAADAFFKDNTLIYLVCRQKYVWIGKGIARLSPSKFRVVNTLSAAMVEKVQA